MHNIYINRISVEDRQIRTMKKQKFQKQILKANILCNSHNTFLQRVFSSIVLIHMTSLKHACREMKNLKKLSTQLLT